MFKLVLFMEIKIFEENMTQQYDLSLTIEQITKEDALTPLIKEIEEAYFDIPFGNTDFQCENFVVAAAITPARAYRTVGLQLHSILESLNQLKFNERLRQIEIEELKEKISDPSVNKYAQMRYEIDLEKILSRGKWHEKLVMDQIVQLKIYYKHFKALPKYTKEQFENSEKLFFEQSQRRMILGITGAKESIMNMIDDKKTIEQFEKMWETIPGEKKNSLLESVTQQTIASLIDFDKK